MRLLGLLLLVASCTTEGAPDLVPDAEEELPVLGKDDHCADTFGDLLTDSFGRVDGTVVALVEPGNPRCALPDDDHLVIQVEVEGEVYRMVVNVRSSFGDPTIYLLALGGIPLPPPAFAEGWHTGLVFDYPGNLDIRWDDAFAPQQTMGQAVTRIASHIEVGDPISVYATSSGGTYAHSAHLIHRSGNGRDGAIVVRPEAEDATWLLFRFADQRF